MKKKLILVCDDNPDDADRWSKEVRAVCPKDFETTPVYPDKFFQAISGLEERRKLARSEKGHRVDCKGNLIDDASIIFIDYDLPRLNSRSYITGENVAYLCRCYAGCGLVVGLNQFGSNYFDLTLRGHPESYADLNIGSEQVANPGLWNETWCGEKTGFRPWYWPLLPAALQAFERRVQDLSVSRALDKRILKYLGFEDEVTATLPRSTREFLGPNETPEDTTFKAFVLKSGNGLRPKDVAPNTESMVRIAAARLWKWLERLVLAGQDILVDAPHLISRYPSLLKGDRKTTAAWNKTTSFARGSGEVNIPRNKNVRFSQSDWVSRPAWFWKKLVNLDEIREIADPFSKEQADFVFCEDTSQFMPREAAREFIADLPSSFVRRFVIDHASKEGKKVSKGVDYSPAVRFSF